MSSLPCILCSKQWEGLWDWWHLKLSLKDLVTGATGMAADRT